MEKCGETICRYYIAFGICGKSSEMGHQASCKNCGKYIPRGRTRHIRRNWMIKEMRTYNDIRLFDKEIQSAVKQG